MKNSRGKKQGEQKTNNNVLGVSSDIPRSSVQGIFQADLGAGGRGVDAPALPGPFRLAVGVATSTLRAATQLAPALRRAPAFSESRQVSSRDELDGMAAVPSREL